MHWEIQFSIYTYLSLSLTMNSHHPACNRSQIKSWNSRATIWIRQPHPVPMSTLLTSPVQRRHVIVPFVGTFSTLRLLGRTNFRPTFKHCTSNRLKPSAVAAGGQLFLCYSVLSCRHRYAIILSGLGKCTTMKTLRRSRVQTIILLFSMEQNNNNNDDNNNVRYRCRFVSLTTILRRKSERDIIKAIDSKTTTERAPHKFSVEHNKISLSG